MQVLGVKFRPWSRVYYYKEPERRELSLGDFVIAQGDWGEDIGGIVTKEEKKESNLYQGGKILRKADAQELEKLRKINKRQEELIIECERVIRRTGLPLKLIDAYYPWNEKFVVVAFIAEERLDFRDLAKELNRKLQKTVRLEHISFRRAASFYKGVGVCGRELCCTQFSSFKGIPEKALLDNLSNKFGVCGCVKCCLFFEKTD